MGEKRIRRTQAQINALVDKVKQMVAAGTPATTACASVGIQYKSYLERKGTGPGRKSDPSSAVQTALSHLIEAIRKEVRAEIKASL